MTSVSPSTPTRSVSRLEWFVLWLLVMSVAINYIDRGNLSVGAVDIANELHLRPFQLGVLLSAFFWTYATFQVVSGWLIDRFNVIWVMAIGYFLWSAATALTGFVSGFAVLFVVRLLLGMGESVAYPSYSKILAASFPEKQRGIANGAIDAGSKLGPAIGLLLGGIIVARFGWRMLFISVGFVSLLWLIPWCIAAPKLKNAPRVATHGGPGFLKILRKRDAWGTFLALFGANYAWYFMLTWIPGYLKMERHYSTEAMALVGSVPFFTISTGAMLGGYLADLWIRRGGSPTLVRKSFVAFGNCVCALFLLPSALAGNELLSMTLLSTATFFFGFFSGNHWAITQTLAGPTAAGKWTGLQNCAGNLAGVVAPSVTGFIVQETHSFYFAFVWVCVNLFVSAFSYVFIIRRVEETLWDQNN